MGLSHTVSGDIASFRTPSRVPIESLKFHFLPKQEGSGDPGPSNVCPITGWNGFKAYHEPTIYYFEQGGLADATGLPTGSQTSRIRTKDFIPCDTTIPKIIDGKSGPNDAVRAIYFYDSNKEFLGSQMAGNEKTFPFTYNITMISSTAYIKIAMWHLDKNSDISPVGKWLIVKDNDQYANIVIFPSNGKNIVNDENIVANRKNMTKVGNRTYTNTATDTRNSVELYIVQYDKDDKILKSNVYYGSVSLGRIGKTFDTVKNCSKVLFKHNGLAHDLGVFIPWDGRIGTYTISANFEGVDISTIGGFTFSDIQIELGDTMTSYESYSSDNTFYGGYYDPVAGEIVAEYTIEGPNSGDWTIGSSRSYQWQHTKGRDAQGHFKKNICTHWINNKHNYYSQDSVINVNENGALCIGKDYFVAAGFDYDNLTSSQITEYLEQQENNGTPFRVCYPLLNPIHIPVTPQDFKAFLDHNNFWSDANDITEVTYAVTESKDMLATRKLAMDFDMGHRKKVKWNQLVKELTLEYWKPYKDVNTLTANAGELTLTLNEISSTTYQNSIITNTSARTNCIPGHKYYFIYYFCPSWDTYGIGFSILNQNSPVYPQAYANTYTKCSSICVHSGNSGNHNIMLAYSGWDKSWTVGSTIKCKTPIMVDITLMFGEGNEPSTVEEFEHICEINGIDLTTYQPYDTGSDRWLILP